LRSVSVLSRDVCGRCLKLRPFPKRAGDLAAMSLMPLSPRV
jgi:hypothetical protein